MSTPINILLKNHSILNDIETCDVKMTEGNSCIEVSLSFQSMKWYADCDPEDNFGDLIIKVIIGSTIYEFLCEERSTDVNVSNVSFTAWGRSKHAYLWVPFSKVITDTEDTAHPWQTANRSASYIVDYVVSNFCPYSVTVTWNAYDFTVYEDELNLNNQSPIQVISRLADVIGAEIVANVDGSLTVQAYSVAEGTSVASYDDLDDIVQLSEKVPTPLGYNAVTIYGYDEGAGEGVQAWMQVERLTDDTLYYGDSHKVRVYYYHSGGLEPSDYEDYGQVIPAGTGTERIKEEVGLIWGKGNRSKVPTDGVQEYTGNESKPYDTEYDSYYVRYKDYWCKGYSTFGGGAANTGYFVAIRRPYGVSEWMNSHQISGYAQSEILTSHTTGSVAGGTYRSVANYNALNFIYADNEAEEENPDKNYTCMFYFSDRSAYTTYSWTEVSREDAESYTVVVTDSSSGDPVEGVTVKIDGSTKGTTDANGEVYIGTLSAGDHTVWIGSKSGYYDSDDDDLDNDEFTIS